MRLEIQRQTTADEKRFPILQVSVDNIVDFILEYFEIKYTTLSIHKWAPRAINTVT